MGEIAFRILNQSNLNISYYLLVICEKIIYKVVLTQFNYFRLTFNDINMKLVDLVEWKIH